MLIKHPPPFSPRGRWGPRAAYSTTRWFHKVAGTLLSLLTQRSIVLPLVALPVVRFPVAGTRFRHARRHSNFGDLTQIYNMYVMYRLRILYVYPTAFSYTYTGWCRHQRHRRRPTVGCESRRKPTRPTRIATTLCSRSRRDLWAVQRAKWRLCSCRKTYRAPRARTCKPRQRLVWRVLI